MASLLAGLWATSPPTTIFFDELDKFFNDCVVNFRERTLYLYQMGIINKVLVLPPDSTLKSSIPDVESHIRGQYSSQHPTREPLVAFILSNLFSRETQRSYNSLSPKYISTNKGLPTAVNYMPNVLDSGDNITLFPERLEKLASAYYSIVESRMESNMLPLKPDGRLEFDQEGFEELKKWINFLNECVNFRNLYGFIPAQTYYKLRFFDPTMNPETNEHLTSLAGRINQLVQTRSGGVKRNRRNRRNRSTRIKSRTRTRTRTRSRSQTRTRRSRRYNIL